MSDLEEDVGGNTPRPEENEDAVYRNGEGKTFGEFIGSFCGRKLENKLQIRHDPETHEWVAVDWASSQLLKGILANNRYPEQLHQRLLEIVTSYGLRVICLESTDSMLKVLEEITKMAKQKEGDERSTYGDAENG